MNVIFVGAGGTTRELLRRLGEVWEVTVIDTEADRLAQAEKVRPIDQVLGDGSSRVVLERAGLERSHALVAATGDDSTNLEACRIALDAGLMRVAAVAANPEHTDAYRELGVPTFSPDSLAARELEAELEPRRVSSSSFARGRAEAIEFEIAPDSPVRGIPLRDLHSERYLVAAILRQGNLIVPHGNTVLEQGDLVTVVGAAADFSFIVRTFTSAEARFPADFGKNVVVALGSRRDLEGPVAEAAVLTRNSNASGLIVVYRDPEKIGDETQAVEAAQLVEAVRSSLEGVDVLPRPVTELPAAALAKVVGEESVGVVVLPPPPSGELLGRVRAVRELRAAWRLGTPVLFSRGTLGSGTILAPARITPAGRAAARAAIDLAVYTKSSFTGVAVVSPPFLAGGDTKEDAQRSMMRLREEAAALGVRPRRLVRQGNPVRVIEDVSAGAGLVVLGMGAGAPSITSPGITGHLARRLEVSVLLVPAPA